MDWNELCRKEHEIKEARELFSRELRNSKLKQRAEDEKNMGWFEYSGEYHAFYWFGLFISGALVFAYCMEKYNW